MEQDAAAELRLEPCALRGHEHLGVGDCEQLIDAGGVEVEGDLRLAAVNQPLQLLVTADPTDEADPLVGAGIVNAEQRLKDAILEDRDIELLDGIVL